MNIHLHIERLILDGLPIGSRQDALMQAAVEAELVRLLVQGGGALSLQSGGAGPRVRADALQRTAQRPPAPLGQQITPRVYAGMGTTR